MEKRIQVTVLRDHRNGYAPGGKAEKGKKFAVPSHRVPSMVRQKLVTAPEDKTEKSAS